MASSVSNISVYLGSNDEGLEFQKEIEAHSIRIGKRPSQWIRELIRKELDKALETQ